MVKSRMGLVRVFSACFAIVIAAILFTGCAGTPVNPPSGTIAGIPGAKAKVVLRGQQEVRVASNATLVFPAGDYRPNYIPLSAPGQGTVCCILPHRNANPANAPFPAPLARDKLISKE